MLCPRCHQETKVIRSYRQPTQVRRRRACTSCGTRFSTHEHLQQQTNDDYERTDNKELAEVRKKTESAIRIMTDIIEDIEEGSPDQTIPAPHTAPTAT